MSADGAVLGARLRERDLTAAPAALNILESVAPADRDRIFQRFYRAAVVEAEAGHGLGLNIAQAIARLHGLELLVEDSVNGAHFVMRASKADRF